MSGWAYKEILFTDAIYSTRLPSLAKRISNSVCKECNQFSHISPNIVLRYRPYGRSDQSRSVLFRIYNDIGDFPRISYQEFLRDYPAVGEIPCRTFTYGSRLIRQALPDNAGPEVGGIQPEINDLPVTEEKPQVPIVMSAAIRKLTEISNAIVDARHIFSAFLRFPSRIRNRRGEDGHIEGVTNAHIVFSVVNMRSNKRRIGCTPPVSGNISVVWLIQMQIYSIGDNIIRIQDGNAAIESDPIFCEYVLFDIQDNRIRGTESVVARYSDLAIITNSILENLTGTYAVSANKNTGCIVFDQIIVDHELCNRCKIYIYSPPA